MILPVFFCRNCMFLQKKMLKNRCQFGICVLGILKRLCSISDTAGVYLSKLHVFYWKKCLKIDARSAFRLESWFLRFQGSKIPIWNLEKKCHGEVCQIPDWNLGILKKMSWGGLPDSKLESWDLEILESWTKMSWGGLSDSKLESWNLEKKCHLVDFFIIVT